MSWDESSVLWLGSTPTPSCGGLDSHIGRVGPSIGLMPGQRFWNILVANGYITTITFLLRCLILKHKHRFCEVPENFNQKRFMVCWSILWWQTVGCTRKPQTFSVWLLPFTCVWWYDITLSTKGLSYILLLGYAQHCSTLFKMFRVNEKISIQIHD